MSHPKRSLEEIGLSICFLFVIGFTTVCMTAKWAPLGRLDTQDAQIQKLREEVAWLRGELSALSFAQPKKGAENEWIIKKRNVAPTVDPFPAVVDSSTPHWVTVLEERWQRHARGLAIPPLYNDDSTAIVHTDTGGSLNAGALAAEIAAIGS